jgi:plasmid stabilization system protein ParE
MTDKPPAAPRGAERVLELAQRLQKEVHERAIASSPMFSKAHWEHHAGEDWPQEPDDDSYLFFENCVHPDCVLVRSGDAIQAAPAPRDVMNLEQLLSEWDAEVREHGLWTSGHSIAAIIVSRLRAAPASPPLEEDEELCKEIASAIWALPRDSRDEWRALMKQLRERLAALRAAPGAGREPQGWPPAFAELVRQAESYVNLSRARGHDLRPEAADAVRNAIAAAKEALAALPAPPGADLPPDDETRCAICGWSLVEQVQRGCVRGNCSLRPFPQWFYAPQRAAREYGQDLTRFDRRATLPAGAVPPSTQERP